MKTRSKLLFAGATLAALALLGWAFAPRPLAVEVAQASTGRYEQAVLEDGRTRLRERYALTAPLAGRLLRLTLREGDAVAAGQVVAEIRPSPAPMLDARSRSELQARRAAAEAGVQRAAAAVGQQRALLEQARNALARSEQLAQQGFIAGTQLVNERLAADAARQALAAAEQAQHIARHELELAQAALQLSQAGPGRGDPASFVLKAPVAGRVLKLGQLSETTVAPGTLLLEIGNLAQLEVLAELLTPDALALPPAAPVAIARWGGPGELQGRVRRIEPAAFTKVSALGVEEQRVNVLIDITSPAAQWAALGDGYRVGVRILTRQQDGALLVPVSAVFPARDGAGSAVFVIDGGRARLRAVTLAGRNGAQAWVGAGLKAGETVIVYPPAEVADGVRVKARNTPG